MARRITSRGRTGTRRLAFAMTAALVALPATDAAAETASETIHIRVSVASQYRITSGLEHTSQGDPQQPIFCSRSNDPAVGLNVRLVASLVDAASQGRGTIVNRHAEMDLGPLSPCGQNSRFSRPLEFLEKREAYLFLVRPE